MSHCSLVLLLIGFLGLSTAWSQEEEPPPQCEFKVAFIGDAGTTENAKAVLELIKSENAQMVLHQGDLGYADPVGWVSAVNDILGKEFPYFFSVGNHDTGKRQPDDCVDCDDWTHHYLPFLIEKIRSVEGLSCRGELDGEFDEGGRGIRVACSYRGVFFILSDMVWPDAEEFRVQRRASLSFLRNELSQDESVWQICSWHFADPSMSLGSLVPGGLGLEPYQICKDAGAIIATAHSHSYSRTKTLIQINREWKRVNPDWPDAKEVLVDNGSTFAFVSGLGGNGIDPQLFCLPGSNNPACEIWASSYDQQYGALFIDFNCDKDPRKAHGYFMNIDGEKKDDFTICSHRGADAPAPEFIRGDANYDLMVDPTDAIFILSYLFLGGINPSITLDRVDVNDSGGIGVSDPIRLLCYLFIGCEPPPAPYPEPGVDPTADGLE